VHKIDIYNLAIILSLITAILTLVFQAADYQRNGVGSFRRVVGGLIVLLGCAVSLEAWHLLSGHSRPGAFPDSVKVGAAVAGVVLVVAGVAVAARAPLNQTEQTLRILARAAHDSLASYADAHDLHGRPFVRRDVIPNGSARRRPLKRMLPRRREKLVVLYGEPGIGKTVALRHLAGDISERAMRRRRPRLMAIYIDLAILPPPSPTLTTDQIRDYIRTTIAGNDSALLSRMELVFREAPDRPRWIFLFDSIYDPLTGQDPKGDRDIELQYLSVVNRFLETGISFYAVAATKHSGFGPTLPGPAITLSPLSVEQQHQLIRQSGLTSHARGVIRHWLRHDPKMALLAQNPILLTLFCDALHSMDPSQVPTQLYEIIDAAIEARLRSSGGSVPDEVHQAIENIACSLAASTGLGSESGLAPVTEAAASPDPDAVALFDKSLALLRDAEIIKPNQGEHITFTHQVFRDHFAAKVLMRAQEAIDATALFTDPSWEEPLTTCLAVGPAQIRLDLLIGAEELLEREQRKATGLIADPSLFLHGEESRLTPVSFEWPANALRALRIITSGLGETGEAVPESVERIADSFVASSFLSGTRREQWQAIQVIAASSPQVGVQVMERIANSGSSDLRFEAAKQLSKQQSIYQYLSIKTRFLLTCAALLRSDVLDYALSRLRTPAQRYGLPAALGYVLQVMWWSAAVLLVWFGHELSVDALKNLPLSAAATTSVIIAGSFLIAWKPKQRRIEYDLAMIAAGLMGCYFIIIWIIGLADFIGAFGDIITVQFAAGVSGLIIGYACTWPLMMIGSVLISTPSSWLDWLMPHRRLIQVTAEQFHWNRLSRGLSSIIVPLVVLIYIAAIWAIAAYLPLPTMPKHKTNDIRYEIGLGLGISIYLGIFAAYRWRRWANSKRARRQVMGRSMNAQDVLSLFQAADTRAATVRLLADMQSWPSDSLQPAKFGLRDLARALSHVEDFVPAETTRRIPASVWTVGPEFATPGFKKWLIDFDLQHPGRLSWLSRSHQDDIVGMLSRLDVASRQVGRE